MIFSLNRKNKTYISQSAVYIDKTFTLLLIVFHYYFCGTFRRLEGKRLKTY